MRLVKKLRLLSAKTEMTQHMMEQDNFADDGLDALNASFHLAFLPGCVGRCWSVEGACFSQVGDKLLASKSSFAICHETVRWTCPIDPPCDLCLVDVRRPQVAYTSFAWDRECQGTCVVDDH